VLGLWILIGLVVVLGIAAVFSYNRFVTQRTLIKDSWANIDTELRRRYDLIPNLVETVRGYASHERETFEEVTRARAMAASATGSPAEQAAAEGPFVAALRQLFAVVENYPDLKANQNFLALQAELSNTEDRLQTARRFYNANVRDYNRRVAAFPSSVIAGMFHFEEEQYFEVDEALRGDAGVPRVSFGGEAPGVTFGDGQTGSAPPAGQPNAPIAGGGAAGAAPAEAAPADPPAPTDPAPAEEPTPPTPERPDE
jgi:LemA protein